jgi:hypothetical protein
VRYGSLSSSLSFPPTQLTHSLAPLLPPLSQILTLMTEQSGWELKKMREEPHEWVDSLIDHCVEVWEYMEQCDEFGDASSSVREQVRLPLLPPSLPLR